MRVVDLKIEDIAFGGKASRGKRAKPFLFLTRWRTSLFRRKLSGKRNNSPKQSCSKLRRVPRIASRRNAHISADAVAALISISITNFSLQSNGDRCVTPFSESAN